MVGPIPINHLVRRSFVEVACATIGFEMHFRIGKECRSSALSCDRGGKYTEKRGEVARAHLERCVEHENLLKLFWTRPVGASTRSDSKREMPLLGLLEPTLTERFVRGWP